MTPSNPNHFSLLIQVPLRRWLLAAALVTAIGITAAILAAPHSLAHPAAFSRPLEPVILSGEEIASLDGVPASEISAFAYAASGWQQIPMQVDEVNASGAYTLENGLLDANDEIVFMAMDLGGQAPPTEWISDSASLAHPRLEIRVTDPLSPTAQGWVYLYRSTTIPAVTTDYVSWNAAGSRLEAVAYAAGFDPATTVGLASLELNGSSVDVLDRSKIRVNATCYFFSIPLSTTTITEENLAAIADFTPDVDGPVRVGGGSLTSSLWAYAAMFQTSLSVDTGAFTPPPPCTSIHINWLRVSNDWLDPALSGMSPALYFDAQTAAGVSINGSPDSVPATPANAWAQVSGSRGSLVQLTTLALGGGTVSNYYKDDQTPDAADTGDQRSYGDAGFRVDNPTGLVDIAAATFILPPGQPNLGAAYQPYAVNPLQAAVTVQNYAPRYWLFLPLARR